MAAVPGVAGYESYSERFQLVAEVLSPTNKRMEIDLKLRRYREAPDNLYVVIIEPRELMVDIRAKRHDWQPTVLRQPDEAIVMPPALADSAGREERRRAGTARRRAARLPITLG